MGQSASSSLDSEGRNDESKSTTNGEQKNQTRKSLVDQPRRSSSLLAQFKDVTLPPVTLASPNEWKQTFNNLTDVELQELILSAPVSEKDVKFMAAAILQQSLGNDGSGSGSSESKPATDAQNINEKAMKPSSKQQSDPELDNDSHHHFYVTSAAQLTKRGKCGGSYPDQSEDELTSLCFRILRVSPTMAKLRFRLVPTKLKEHVFWSALWTILYQTLQQQEDDAEEQDINGNSSNDITATTTPSNTQQRSFFTSPFSPKNGNNATTANNDNADIDREFADFSRKRAEETIFTLRRTIEKQEWKIEELQKELENRNGGKGSQTESAAQTTPPAVAALSPKKSASSATNPHVGPWVMDSDSKDFLEYPEELKVNLRMEKQKRLQEVKEQMKFILDSDNIEDSQGSWKCCGQKEYNAVCLRASHSK